MRSLRFFTAVLVIGLVTAATAATATTKPTPAVHPQTRDNLTAAAKGEAFAHAKYLAYAGQAQREGQPAIARLFMQTSRVEFGDHFLKLARMAGIVGSNAANLSDAIAGENSEATTIYPGFAAQAKAQGDQRAFDFWTGTALDEAVHRDNFKQALTAITNPSSGVRIPAPPIADPVTIQAGAPQSSGVTLDNLYTTLRGESFANAKYTAYGLKASQTAEPRLARLWQGPADVELREHFAEAATLAGLVRHSATNLRDAIQGETAEATSVYVGYAKQAQACGDRAAAQLFAELARDEAGHAAQFIKALQNLELPR